MPGSNDEREFVPGNAEDSRMLPPLGSIDANAVSHAGHGTPAFVLSGQTHGGCGCSAPCSRMQLYDARRSR